MIRIRILVRMVVLCLDVCLKLGDKVGLRCAMEILQGKGTIGRREERHRGCRFPGSRTCSAQGVIQKKKVYSKSHGALFYHPLSRLLKL